MVNIGPVRLSPGFSLAIPIMQRRLTSVASLCLAILGCPFHRPPAFHLPSTVRADWIRFPVWLLIGFVVLSGHLPACCIRTLEGRWELDAGGEMPVRESGTLFPRIRKGSERSLNEEVSPSWNR